MNSAGCGCKLSVSGNINEETAYSASGSKITETDAVTGAVTSGDYCVRGSVLRVTDPDGNIVIYERK